MDMGLEPYLLASGIVGVIAQRLMRITCVDCKAPATYSPEMLAKVGLTPDPDLVFYSGRGCDACAGTGYRGRTGAFEILVVDHGDQHVDPRARRFAPDQAGGGHRWHEHADGRRAVQGDLRTDDARRSLRVAYE